MGIKIQHQPSYDSLGKSAYAIGAGAKAEREQARKDKNSAINASNALKAQQIRSQANSRNASIIAHSQDSQRRAKAQEESLAFSQKTHKDRMGLELQEGLRQQKLLEERNTVYEYTPEQTMKINKIQSAIANTRQQVSTNELTPEQAEELELKLRQNLKAIIPVKRQRTEKTPQEMFDQLSVTNQDGLGLIQDPKSGKFYADPYAEKIMDTARDLMKLTTTDKEGISRPMYTFSQALNEAKTAMGGFRKTDDMSEQNKNSSILEPEIPETQNSYTPKQLLNMQLQKQRAKSDGRRTPEQKIEFKASYALKNPNKAIKAYANKLDEESLLELREVFQSGDKLKIQAAIQIMVQNGIIQ